MFSTLVVVVHELDDGELAVVCTVVIDVGGKHFLYLSVFVLQWSERDFGHPSLKRLLFEVGRSDRDFEITHGPIL